MSSSCVGKLRMSRKGAYKRIRVARAALQFPAIFVAIEEGRLHLSGMVILAPHLTPENVDELLAAATHKTELEIERLLAERFPRPDVPTKVVVISQPTTAEQIPQMALSSRRVETESVEQTHSMQLSPPILETSSGMPSPEMTGPSITVVPPSAPTPSEVPAPRAKVTPLSAQRVAMTVSIEQSEYEVLLQAQELLGHQIPSGDLAKVLGRLIVLGFGQLKKQRIGGCGKSRGNGQPSANPRHIPARVKHAVWARDDGRCTFVSDSGHRCDSRTRLELDHVDPVARGGQSSVANLRLRCRAHNQYTAEKEFRADFMKHKREEARQRESAHRAA